MGLTLDESGLFRHPHSTMIRPNRTHVPPKAILVARKRMNDVVRDFFDSRGFLEVETPIAMTSPGLEPHLEIFETTEQSPSGHEETLYLHTSPEYAMKRLLAHQLGSIYQIARVFRNGERSSTHAPEFTLLEWYRQPGTLKDIIADTSELIYSVARAVGGWIPEGVEEISVSEAFNRVGLPDPLEYMDNLDALRSALDTPAIEGDDCSTVFFRSFFTHIEPSFHPNKVTILTGYPASMAALAKVDPDNPKRSLRFEVFVGPLELANAFDELTDPQEQRLRFEADLRERAAKQRPCPPIDEHLLEALPQLGQVSGIALGLDRLLMKCLKVDAIQEVISLSPRDS